MYMLFIYLSKVKFDHPPNLINYSLYHCQATLKMSSRSIITCLSNVGNKQTNKPKRQQKHNLLVGGNN